MKNQLKYRDNNYFNGEDLYLVLTNLGKYYVTGVHLYGGNWYSNEGLKLKMTSIESINCNELYHREVRLIDTEVKGKLVKYLNPNSLGIYRIVVVLFENMVCQIFGTIR